jgi:hypothetical protein
MGKSRKRVQEIIADNLEQSRMELGLRLERSIPTGERSGLQTHIATMESASLCELMKG